MSNIIASGQITLVDLNDAKSLSQYITSSQPKVQIYNPTDGSVTPDWSVSTPTDYRPVLTPELYVTGTNTNIMSSAKYVIWYEGSTAIYRSASAPGGALAAATGYAVDTAANGYKLTISANKMSAGTPQINYVCEVSWTDTTFGADIVSKADINFTRISAGTSPVSVILSNDSVVYGATDTGTVSSYTGSGTDIHVYDGATELTYDSAWTTANGKYKVTANATSISAGTLSLTNSLYATAAAPSLMTADTASISYRVQGKTGNGTAIDISVVQSFAKSKQGSTPTSYWLDTGASVIQKAKDGTLSPGTITAAGYSQVGTSAPGTYAASYKFYTTTTTQITSSTNWGTATTLPASGTATTATYPASGTLSGITGVKVEMYTSTGTLLDSQVIPVVADGTNAVIAYVWAPNGNIVKNASGSVTLQCDVYNGTTALTSGVTYQWSKLSGGSFSDVTGGSGKTLSVAASDVPSMATYKCTATVTGAGAGTYSDVCVVVDQSDPIQVSLIAAEGNVFRNGAGTKNVTAKVYRVGTELDATPVNGVYLYEYRWYLRGQDGTPVASFVDHVAEPTVQATATATGSGGTTAAGTYNILYTWVNKNGETLVSTIAKSLVVTAGQTITVTVPAFPQDVTSANIYMGTTVGSETLQGSIATSGASFTKSTVLAAGAAKPSTNTTGSSSYKTGKTLTVLPENVTNIGNLVLELWG